MIRAISFDVGQTLLRPYPSFGEVVVRRCAQAGETFGTEAVGQVEVLADAYFADLRRAGVTYSHSEDLSREVWLGLYRRFLAGQAIAAHRVEELAEQIYATFLDHQTYRLYDDAIPTLQACRAIADLRVGVTSNWEPWLRDLLISTGLEPFLDFRIISGAVGFEKPHPRIFELAAEAAGVAPNEILHIGDSLTSDYHGALAAGFQAVLLDRDSHYHDDEARRITSLAEVMGLLGSD
jgi:putative hydrolase of the HAD superfamily